MSATEASAQCVLCGSLFLCAARFPLDFDTSFDKNRRIIFCGESPKCRNIKRYEDFTEKCRLKILSLFVQNFQWSENFVGFLQSFQSEIVREICATVETNGFLAAGHKNDKRRVRLT